MARYAHMYTYTHAHIARTPCTRLHLKPSQPYVRLALTHLFLPTSERTRSCCLCALHCHVVLQGRDMGLDSINGFELKIASGNAQVYLSRDLARLSTRLDLFRLLHFYYSGLGHFTTALLLVAALNVQLLSSWALAMAGVPTVTSESGTVVDILYGTPYGIVMGGRILHRTYRASWGLFHTVYCACLRPCSCILGNMHVCLCTQMRVRTCA